MSKWNSENDIVHGERGEGGEGWGEEEEEKREGRSIFARGISFANFSRTSAHLFHETHCKK
jgi:hypothetical protein